MAIYLFCAHTGVNFNTFIITIAPVIGAIALVISVSSVASRVDVGIPMDHAENEPVHGLLGWLPKKDKSKNAFGSCQCMIECSSQGNLI